MTPRRSRSLGSYCIVAGGCSFLAFIFHSADIKCDLAIWVIIADCPSVCNAICGEGEQARTDIVSESERSLPWLE